MSNNKMLNLLAFAGFAGVGLKSLSPITISKNTGYTPKNYKFAHKGRFKNKPCPCNSNIKFKNCCWEVQE